MDTSGFYKYIPEYGILYAAHAVQGNEYQLDREWKDTYDYPVDGWYWFDTKEQAEIGFVAPASIPDTVITKLAVRHRFTPVERVTIEIASLDDPTASMQARQLAATLRASQVDLVAAKWIDLSRADTITGVQTLEAFGLLGPGRAAEIISAPIQDIERP